MKVAENYPLQWPDGWARTPAIRRKVNGRIRVNMSTAVHDLHETLRLMRARSGSVVISTNVRPRAVGVTGPVDDNAQDPGVAVYWVARDGRSQSAACDSWVTVLQNLRALGKALEGLRMVEESGATAVSERMFQAFGELPPSSSAVQRSPWWLVLGIDEKAIGFITFAMVQAKHHELVKQSRHPDHGGSNEGMVDLNVALQEAKKHYAGG